MELIKGNCLEKLKDIPDKSVDLAYMDLCYGQTACKWDKKFTKDEWVIFWKELKRVARNDRTPFFFSCTTKFGFDIIESNKKWFRWDLVWKKNRAAGFLNAYKIPMRKHEMIYCFSKKCPEYDISSHLTGTTTEKKPSKGHTWMESAIGHSVCFDKPHISKEVKVPLPTSDITPPTEEHELVYCFSDKCPAYDVSSHSEYKEDKECSHHIEINGMDKTNKSKSKRHKALLPTTDITPPPIDIDEEEPSSWCEFKSDERTGHRTAKPVALMEFLLKYWCKEGGTVLDPTMGSGSMGIACKKMNRKFIGIELNDDIYELAKKRIGV
jgi:DNA modification methylase